MSRHVEPRGMRNEERRGKEKHPEYTAEPNPMDEENFPDNPARRAADREMAEPTNVPGAMPPRRMKRPEVEGEGEDELGGRDDDSGG